MYGVEMVNTQMIPSCCVGKLFKDFGGAHGVREYTSFEDFEKILYALSPVEVNVALLTEGQRQSREFLEKSGWEGRKVSSRMYVFTIPGYDFAKRKFEYRKRVEEEARKKKEALKAQAKSKATDVPNFVEGTSKDQALSVKLAEIERIFRLNQDPRDRARILRERYGLTEITSISPYIRDTRGMFNSIKTRLSRKNRKD